MLPELKELKLLPPLLELKLLLPPPELYCVLAWKLLLLLTKLPVFDPELYEVPTGLMGALRLFPAVV